MPAGRPKVLWTAGVPFVQFLTPHEKLIGNPMFFSLTSGWAKFYQVDSHRQAGKMKREF
jgi:hypothetical protein